MEWKGIGAAPGFAMGPAFLLQRDEVKVERRSLSREEAGTESKRFDEKVAVAIVELERIRENAKQKLGEQEAEIFSAHILVLQDPEYIGAVKEKIQTEQVNAEAALQEVTDSFVELFESMENEYMRERAADIRDVSNRVMQRLAGISETSMDDFAEPVVLLAHDLTPSDTAQLDREKVAGFATDIGGRTSHSAIMARSMEIPAVVGLREITAHLKTGDYLILDGQSGIVLVNPQPEVIREYRQKADQYAAQQAEYKKLKDEPSLTADGLQVELAANIGNPQDAVGAVRNGAEGVGLYRTEFLYMGRDTLPTEEEQFEAYKAVAETFGKDHPIVIRSLDIGGDKELPYLDLQKELNPFLGYRAIRLCLDRSDIFKTQLRAILRASVYGNIKLMYPMIASLQELRAANRVLEEVKQELKRDKISFREKMEVGMMIEVPAAAIIADQLAKEVDFFSIGTNDLIQYTMAVDRMNEKISYLYQPFNPAVLRLIKTVIDAAHREGKWAGMCGEMAGNKTAIPILLGMGLDEFSMSASSILPARALLRKLNKPDMQSLAETVLQMDAAEEIKRYVEREVPAVKE
jgi:phosphotransferase system enzyme I (PtsI)